MLLMAGMPMLGTFSAQAAPEPQSQSQTVTAITGTVLDENNEPVIGASVVQKGVAGIAAATDAFCHFTLRVPAGAILQISYVGYKPVEQRAAADMTVYLQPTTEMLNELVAIGYGSQKRANLTGAVATVDVARTMESRPVTDVAKALQGAVPGLTITSANGDISSNPTINIRGVGTLSNSHTSSPLIVVDGVPVDDLSFVNAEDIESISVLKDASSSAIYGSRAAFGVILVTTKNADTLDKVSVNYNNNFGWGTATVLPEFNTTVNNLLVAMDDGRPGRDEEIFGMYYSELLPFAQAWAQQHGGKQYTSLVELHPFTGWDNVGDYYCPDPNNRQMPAGLAGWNYDAGFKSNEWLSYADWDVRKTLFKPAFSQKHNVSLEGRSGNTNYRVSFGYDGREGLWRYNPDKMNRYMANASIDTKIFKWLRAGARFNFSQREYTSPHLSARNAYQYVWRFPSQFENYGYIIDPDGNPMGFRNEITYRQNGYNGTTTTAQTRMQAYMIADLFPGFQLQADYTYTLRNMNSDDARLPFTMYSQWTSGQASPATWTTYSQTGTYAAESARRYTNWTANVFGTYSKTFADAHNLKVMLGWTGERSASRYFYAQRNGLVDYQLPNLNLTDGTNYSTSAEHFTSATTGFFGRINYDYKGIYLVEFNGRYDGSSSFPANDQWAFFPSGSVGYRFSEENYFEPVKSWWSNGKIRASYGHVGNPTVGSYLYLPRASQVSAGNIHWLTGNQKIAEYSMPSLVSSTLTWERIVTTDVGIDLGFFNNSLNIGFDWFQRDTKDMIGLSQEYPAVLGATAPLANSGELRTRGWELSINWNHSFGDADVYATFNIGDARTKISKWQNPKGTIYSYNPTYSANSNAYFTPGGYYGDIWGFETERYFTMDDFHWDPTADKGVGRYVPNPGVADQTYLETGDFHYGPGDVKFADLNGDGKIDAGDRTLENHGDLKVIGNALPRYEYSFRIGGAWKGFDLDLFFQGVGKRDMWATGSTIIPMAQSAYGTFTNQLSYNKVEYADGLSGGEILSADINQDYDYPRMYSKNCGIGVVGYIGRGQYNFYPQSKYLTSLAYLRLKNITFGYTLPVELTRKALIQKARLYFSADNVCFLHNGAGKYQLDPEMTTSSGSSVQGTDSDNGTFGRTVPLQRTFSFGVQVTF